MTIHTKVCRLPHSIYNGESSTSTSELCGLSNQNETTPWHFITLHGLYGLVFQ